MNAEQRNELLYQALETEIGGVDSFQTMVPSGGEAIRGDIAAEQ